MVVPELTTGAKTTRSTTAEASSPQRKRGSADRRSLRPRARKEALMKSLKRMAEVDS